MDTSRYRDPGSRFQIFDLSARLAFRSASSISFQLGRFTDTPPVLPGTPDDAPPEPPGPPDCCFLGVGRVDVHHPCDGHIKTQLHVIAPAEYLEFEKIKPFVATLFEALGIPLDETFEAHFVHAERQTGYENATDRNGKSDRVY